MKKLFLFLLFLTIEINSFGQVVGSAAFNQKAKSVFVFVLYTKEKDKTIYLSKGCGFILKDSYVVTCYHIFHPQDAIKILEMYVKYNLRIIDNSVVYDSVFITNNYKHSKSQINFSKQFVQGDYRTDFIVLKIKGKILFYKFKSNSTYGIGEDVFALGIHSTITSDRKETINFAKERMTIIIKYSNHNINFFGFFGGASEGFSGCPVTNQDGEIIGMIQAGWNELDKKTLDKWLYENKINQQTYNQIIDAYYQKSHKEVGFAIDINSLKKYLTGYLN
ncbi:MAG TPA: trypsin-like peptidase domain-containing protein [Mucilaginibacter sp.]|jgi:S1-C subfamily serine protease